MINILREIMQPEIQASERVGRIKGTVETLKGLGFGNEEIEAKIMKSYGIDEEADKYIHA